MIIQKVFSNVENGNEKLYSVLMTEEEYMLFSEKKNNLSPLETAGALVASGATLYGVHKGAEKLSQTKLAQKGADKLVNAYYNTKIGKAIDNGLNKIADSAKEHNLPEKAEKVIAPVRKTVIRGAAVSRNTAKRTLRKITKH